MSCNWARSLAQGRAAKGFYTLFYDWSILTSSAVRKPRYLHSLCSQSNPKERATKTRSYLRRQYSSSPTPKEVENDVPNTTPETEPPLSSQLRKLMRTMPHSVVVVTSTAPSFDRGTLSSFKGMTVSSFTTLALTPSPIVTFNIRKPSRTLAAISESKQFFIHILSATRSGARVARAFAKGNGIGPDPFFMNIPFSVLRWRPDGTARSLDPPLLAGDGITKVLRCELLEEKGLIEAGDHVLILGKVLGIVEPSLKPSDVGRRGLCYLDGAYRAVGSTVEQPEQDPKRKN